MDQRTTPISQDPSKTSAKLGYSHAQTIIENPENVATILRRNHKESGALKLISQRSLSFWIQKLGLPWAGSNMS